jgi:hypothetical protein
VAIRKCLEPDSKLNTERAPHLENDSFPSFSTEEGMQIAESELQVVKAPDPILETFEPDSNAAIERHLHS